MTQQSDIASTLGASVTLEPFAFGDGTGVWAHWPDGYWTNVIVPENEDLVRVAVEKLKRARG